MTLGGSPYIVGCKDIAGAEQCDGRLMGQAHHIPRRAFL